MVGRVDREEGGHLDREEGGHVDREEGGHVDLGEALAKPSKLSEVTSWFAASPFFPAEHTDGCISHLALTRGSAHLSTSPPWHVLVVLGEPRGRGRRARYAHGPLVEHM